MPKNERTGLRPEKFVCRVSCEPRRRSDEPSLWVGLELKAELSHPGFGAGNGWRTGREVCTEGEV